MLANDLDVFFASPRILLNKIRYFLLVYDLRLKKNYNRTRV